MQIRVVAVGKIKEKFLQEGIAEYEKRLRPYVKLQVVELAEEKRPQPASPANESAAMEKEGRADPCAFLPKVPLSLPLT